MKKIIDDKVYITKGSIMKVRQDMGWDLYSPLMPTSMLLKICGVDAEEPQVFFWDSDSDFVFQEVLDNDAKEFVKNADWILDYEYFDGLSLNEIEEEYNKIATVYNPKAEEINAKIDAIEDEDKRVELYNSFKPEMAPMEFAMEEIQQFYFKKKKELEQVEKEKEEAPVQEEIVVKKRTLKDIIRRTWNKKNNK